MQFLTIMALILLPNLAMAVEGYKLDIEVSRNGKVITTPKIIVESGVKASMTQSEENRKTKIAVLAKEGEMLGKKGILLDLEFFDIDTKSDRETIRKAELLLNSGEEASFEVSDPETKERILFKLTATRTSK